MCHILQILSQDLLHRLRLGWPTLTILCGNLRVLWRDHHILITLVAKATSIALATHHHSILVIQALESHRLGATLSIGTLTVSLIFKHLVLIIISLFLVLFLLITLLSLRSRILLHIIVADSDLTMRLLLLQLIITSVSSTSIILLLSITLAISIVLLTHILA